MYDAPKVYIYRWNCARTYKRMKKGAICVQVYTNMDYIGNFWKENFPWL
jgi:hypothetical protein